MKPIVIFNSQDTSRNFPAQCPQDGSVDFLDWNTSDLSTYLGPPLSVYPSVCCSVNASGATSGIYVGLVVLPASWEAANAIITASDNQSQLTSVAVWGANKAGASVTGPLVDQFESAVFTSPSITDVARTQYLALIPLLVRHIDNPGAIALYWATFKNSSPPWTTPDEIAFVEATAAVYKVPLVPGV